MATLIPAFLLFLTGLALIFYFARVFFLGIFPNKFSGRSLSPAKFFAAMKLRRKAVLLEKLSSIEPTLDDEAAEKIRRCFCFDIKARDRVLAEHIHQHNMQAFSHLVFLADAVEVEFENLALVEELFNDRLELMRRYLDVSERQRGFERKFSRGLQKPSHWATHEYKQKIEDAAERILANEQALKDELSKMLHEFKKGQSGSMDEVTYH